MNKNRSILTLVLILVFPIILLISVFITVLLFLNSDNLGFYTSLVSFLVFLIVIIIAYQYNIIQLDRVSLNIKELIVIFFTVAFLFLIFFLNKKYLTENIKYPYPLWTGIAIGLMFPIVEEILIKKIIIDNLILHKFKILTTVIFATIYFTLLHLPEIHITHISFGFITSYIYINNRNLLQVILIHILFNFSIMMYNIML